MMGFSRRSVLRALGAAASWPVLGCGGASGVPRAPTAAAPALRDVAAIRAQLADLVARMGGHADARGFVTLTRTERLRADDRERTSASETAALAVFTAVDASGRVRERATDDISEDGLAAAAAPLLAGGSAPVAIAEAAPAPLDLPLGDDAALDDLLARAAHAGDSRIVYRAAALERWQRHRLCVGRDINRWELGRGARASAGFVAALGAAIVAETAERVGAGSAPPIDDALLAETARGALEQLTARPARERETEVVLAASVVALLVRELVGPAVLGDRWLAGERPTKPLGASPHIELADAPNEPGALGYRGFDDEGTPTRRVPLIAGGELLGPLTDRATAAALAAAATGSAVRDAEGRARPRPSHLTLSPGGAGLEQLLADVERGVLLDGPLAAEVSLPGWQASLRCARGLEIERGALTGRRFGPVTALGDVPAWLSATRAASRDTTTLADGAFASVAAPALLTRARIVSG